MTMRYERAYLTKRTIAVGSAVNIRVLEELDGSLVRVYLVYAFRGDPLTRAHHEIIQGLISFATRMSAQAGNGRWVVVLWPHGPYSDKKVLAPPEVRKGWLQALYGRMPNVALRFDDITKPGFTPVAEMHDLFDRTGVDVLADGWLLPGNERAFVEATPIFVVGEDNVAHIRSWKFGPIIWNFQWCIVPRGGVAVGERPPNHLVLDEPYYTPSEGSATDVRTMIAAGTPGWEEHLAPLPAIAEDIKRLGLYGYKP